jgi:plastocyanin
VKRLAAGLAAGLVATGAAGSAVAQAPHDHAGGGAMADVSILAASYAPAHVDVVAGDTVDWENASVLRHTVTADDGSFGSAQLSGGDAYAHRFAAPGVITYHCTVHPSMRGEVDVRRVLLDGPREPGAPGAPYVLHGRSSLPAGSPVTLERDTGGGFAPAATATVAADGDFAAPFRADRTAQFRATIAGGETSPPVPLLIVDRKVTASARGTVVRAHVTPASPGATVVLQLRQRRHFGWWPARRARLDRHSRVRFTAPVTRPTRARVVLTLRDGATVLARSAVVTAGRAR